MKRYTTMDSPVGLLTLVSDENGLLAVSMQQQVCKALDGAVCDPADPVLADTVNWLRDYFAGKAPSPASLSLTPSGTPFQMRVWQLLLQIPYGETVTYGELAKMLGTPCAQAVGQAVSRNPIGILIPCHRVMGAGNRLTGYNGGIQNKVILLALEGHTPEKLRFPEKN